MTCDILHCNNLNLTDIVDDNTLVNDCSDEFGSLCSLGCITGYMVVGNNMFTCDIVNDGAEWKNNVTGGSFQCDIGTLLAIKLLNILYVSLPSNLYRRFGSTI